MGSTKKLTSMVPVALLVAGLAAPQMANAADLLIDPPIIEAPEVVTQQSGGWYLRGDITYDIHSMDNPMYSAGGTELTFATADTSEAFDVGLGVGYQINENFRVDLTGEYLFSSDFRGTTVGTCGDSNPGDGLPGSPCTSVDTSSWTAFKVLGNAYVDLGNFSGFTPYVGAGLGGAYVSWDSLTNAGTCTTGPAATNSACISNAQNANYTDTATGSTFTDVHGGTDSWRFAWALHTGFSYDLTQNTKLDIGYTYSRIEGGDMFQWLDGSGTQGYDKGFDSHVIRAGLRYQIW